MDVATPFLPVADAIIEAGGGDLTLCFQCATCTGSCPWGFVEPLNMRRLLRLAQLGLEGYEGDDLWKCSTCGMCTSRCPRGVDIIGLVRTIRKMLSETGIVPRSLRGVPGSVSTEGNPWQGDRAKRNHWARALAIPAFERTSTEYLLFACCMPSYDSRARRIAAAAASVLEKAGITVGVLGPEESCCGESVRKIGSEGLFTRLATGNTELFKRHGVEKILTLSPHCHHTFTSEYPEVGGRFQVTHVAELFAALLERGQLSPHKPVEATVTYHDPCYLGRHAGIYDAPRRIIQALPGVTFREMYRTRESSLCCGGGGGRMWMETKFGERFSDLRIPEAEAVGADVLATACPYCISMLEDSRLNLDREEALRVADLSELLAESLDLAPRS